MNKTYIELYLYLSHETMATFVTAMPVEREMPRDTQARVQLFGYLLTMYGRFGLMPYQSLHCYTTQHCFTGLELHALQQGA